MFFITFEIFLIITIKILKKDFKWLLNSEDEFPLFSKKKLNKFYKESYDPIIGWDRKKNKTGFEIGEKKTFFEISKKKVIEEKVDTKKQQYLFLDLFCVL